MALRSDSHAHRFYGSGIWRWHSRKSLSLLHTVRASAGRTPWLEVALWLGTGTTSRCIHLQVWAGRAWRHWSCDLLSFNARLPHSMVAFLTQQLPQLRVPRTRFQQTRQKLHCLLSPSKVTKLHYNHILLVTSPPCSEEGKPRSSSVNGEMSKKLRAIFPNVCSNLHHN